MPKIKFNRKKCIGCGYCEDLSPANWAMNINDGKSDLINSIYTKNLHIAEIEFHELDANFNAANSCPVGIIEVEI